MLISQVEQLSNKTLSGLVLEPSKTNIRARRRYIGSCPMTMGIYLPDYETVTIFHMRDIVTGKRKKVKEINVKHINVPHFEELKIERMIEFASHYQEVIECLPILKREGDKLPRSYVENLIYTIVGEPFK